MSALYSWLHQDGVVHLMSRKSPAGAIVYLCFFGKLYDTASGVAGYPRGFPPKLLGDFPENEAERVANAVTDWAATNGYALQDA